MVTYCGLAYGKVSSVFSTLDMYSQGERSSRQRERQAALCIRHAHPFDLFEPADIVKMIESQPELAPQLRRVRGGYLKIQGTWMPYEVRIGTSLSSSY